MTTGRINQVTILQAESGRSTEAGPRRDCDTTPPKEGRNLVVTKKGRPPKRTRPTGDRTAPLKERPSTRPSNCPH